jgi:CRP/FNR family cyclic AMP-dependent transcriptional regulator
VVPSRTLLVRSGEAPDALFYVIAGSVEVLIEDEHGKELVLAYLGKGEFFGEMGLLEATPGRGAYVRARGRTEIAEMAYSRFRQVAATDPVLALELAAQLAARLERATRKLRDLAFIDVSGRILQALGELCEQPDALTHPEGMQIRVSRQELARLVGCSREMAGRVLRTLEEQGTLRARGKTVVMLGVRPARLLAAQAGTQPAAAAMAPRIARTVAA